MGKYVGRADFEFRNGEMKMVNYQLIPVNLKKKVTWDTGKASAYFTRRKSQKIRKCSRY
ncbi:bifunctional UDP-sugar hydrolase/5'-nucleotidase [Salmonella enterica subsp. arizonae]|nr:bifunctional UDP-sugar hydrolase/5'-nucleotidase [Salmonella enterica subsp. arizonae]